MDGAIETLTDDDAGVAGTRIAPIGLQLVVFLIIGGSAALSFVVLSSLVIGLRTGIADWVMSALCYAAFIGPVYLAHRRFSFQSDAPHLHALPRYVAVQLFGLSLASLFSFVVYGRLGFPTPIAALIVIGLTSAVNFVALRLWAFAAPKVELAR